MKRPGRFFIIGSLIVAVIIVVLGIYVFLRIRRPPEAVKREIIKHFSFSSPRDLEEWDEKVLAPGKSEYSVTEHDGKKGVKGRSEDSASALFFKKQLSYQNNPFLSWDWKVGEFPSRKREETLDKKAEFDFAAQVYVVFHARFFLNAKAIQYVWTETLPAGTVGRSPYTKNVRIMVLESGKSEEWKHEERDIKADFRSLFGQELQKNIAAISFMTDADSTDSTAEAYYADITLGYLETASPPPAPKAAGEEKPVEPEGEEKAEQAEPEVKVETEGTSKSAPQPETGKEPERKKDPVAENPEVKAGPGEEKKAPAKQ